MMEERRLSLREAQAELGISERTIHRWIKSGKLKSYKPGRDHQIPESAIRKVIEESEVNPKLQGALFFPFEEEERRALVNTWRDLLVHVGAQLQDLDGKYDPAGENGDELMTLAYLTGKAYRASDPKTGARPEWVKYLEDAESVLRTGIEMVMQRASESGASVTQLDEYREKGREALGTLEGTGTA